MTVDRGIDSGKRRITWVDYGKGLAIVLVFWGHTICPEPALIFFLRVSYPAVLCAFGIRVFDSSISVIRILRMA